MAKSIRSKCKRKARSEFRRTVGEEFHQKQMAKTQEKLKACIEQQSFKSLDKLTEIFDKAQEATPVEQMETTNTTIGIDAVDEMPAKDLKGENKAPVSKRSKSRKHAIKAVDTKKAERPKRRPKFFVQF
eukprot:Nitzschia sp. Nitz4//scaffold70_size99833//45539//46006//NITZ4_004595-RA/size99833-snap-gene-0.145-mRNA-1//-1//CDS//3329557135//2231//frame0